MGTLRQIRTEGQNDNKKIRVQETYLDWWPTTLTGGFGKTFYHQSTIDKFGTYQDGEFRCFPDSAWFALCQDDEPSADKKVFDLLDKMDDPDEFDIYAMHDWLNDHYPEEFSQLDVKVWSETSSELRPSWIDHYFTHKPGMPWRKLRYRLQRAMNGLGWMS